MIFTQIWIPGYFIRNSINMICSPLVISINSLAITIPSSHATKTLFLSQNNSAVILQNCSLVLPSH